MNGNKGWLVQLHAHTAESSACGIDGGAEMARGAKELGYGTLVVTDHFFNANSRAPKDAEWPKKVEILMAGYRAAKKAGEAIGLTVLFGWETANDGPEYLTYGLGEEFLLAHPDIHLWDVGAYLAAVRRAGGLIIQAHPFRRASYIPLFTPDPALAEGVEVLNGAHCDKGSSHFGAGYDDLAAQMAEEARLIPIAGSDAHEKTRLRYGAMRFPKPVTSNEALIRALRAREGEPIREILS